MNNITKITIPSDARIIVISDIHGEIALFKELLDQVNFNKDDYLIINGDLCEKGNKSKDVVSYVMDLCANNGKVYVTEGNCDSLVGELLGENPDLINYLCSRPNSIINEWMESIGRTINEETDVREVKRHLLGHFSKEINWLSELTTAIETDNYIFVHAGLEDKEDWKDTDRVTAITLPSFMEKSHQANKYVVVGHWPVANYTSGVPNNNPIINESKKIISTDGGNVITTTGQLNAFIIDRYSGYDEFSYTYVDPFPKAKIEKEFIANPTMMSSISYPYFEIIPIEDNDHFTLCEQEETGERLYVKNEYVYQNKNGKFTVMDNVSCAQIEVSVGNVVSVIDDHCTGYSLIKKMARLDG